jgi:hypothetical protein
MEHDAQRQKADCNVCSARTWPSVSIDLNYAKEKKPKKVRDMANTEPRAGAFGIVKTSYLVRLNARSDLTCMLVTLILISSGG